MKGGIKGLRFRRQHPLSIYIVDFYCHNVKLVIEVDGSIHNDPVVIEHDLQREADLRLWGYTIIRFTNERVIKETEKVLVEITKCVEDLLNLK